MAHTHGLHLDLQETIIGPGGAERGRHVWWTVYALNQKLISNIGLPNFLNDRDISSPLPIVLGNSEDTAACRIHLKICQLLSNSISSKLS